MGAGFKFKRKQRNMIFSKSDLLEHLVDNRLDPKIICTIMVFILELEKQHAKEIETWINNTRKLLEKHE
ncbi:hypothetical protein EBU95_15710 [bacterium]|nr:hypothetical protein [bacterium]